MLIHAGIEAKVNDADVDIDIDVDIDADVVGNEKKER